MARDEMMTYKRKEIIGNCTAIYALCQGNDDRPRYIGKTVQYLHKRHKAHIRNAINGSNLPVARWIRKQIKKQEFLTIKLLEYVRSPNCWKEREKYWIAKTRKEHKDCLNLCDGGRGVQGHTFSQEHKDKISKALQKGKNHKCTKCSLEFYRKPNDAKGENLFCSRYCFQTWQKGRKKNTFSCNAGKIGREIAREKRLSITHCKLGHQYIGSNLYITPEGKRVCRECNKIAKQKYKLKSSHGKSN